MGMDESSLSKPLGGRYKLIAPLGAGGFGQTFWAHDLHLPGHPRCVVKQLKPQVNSPQELSVARRLFDTEAQTLYRLGTHPQIPSLLAHFEDDQEFYLAQEMIEGHALDEELAAGQPWRDEQAIAFLYDLLSTLAFVHHHRVIHRDIKPSNLMRRHRDHRIVLIDFGAVKQVTTQFVTAPSTANRTISIGTREYMPSEQIAGRPQFSSDVYAVGMITIQGLTRWSSATIPTHPHTGELDWHRLAPHCSPPLKALLDTMVRYDFRSRYATAAEALSALQTCFPQMVTNPTAEHPIAEHPMAQNRIPGEPERTVAVGRRSQPTRVVPHGMSTSSAGTRSVAATDIPHRRSRSRYFPLLPISFGVVSLLGLSWLVGRMILSSPSTPTVTSDPPVPSSSSASDATAPVDPVQPSLAPPSPDTPELEPTATNQTASPNDSNASPSVSLEETPAPSESSAISTEPSALTPDAAQSTIVSLYGAVSSQSWDAAYDVLGGSLAQQFDPDFFQQFQQVTVDNLQITNQTEDTVELLGQNTYLYRDGSRQREERTFTVQLIEGQPRIVDSDFVRVIETRGNG